MCFREPVKKDYVYYREQVQKDCNNIANVPDEFKTFEVCEMAVKKNGLLLRYVSRRNLRPDNGLFLIAVKQNGFALEYVPRIYKTEQNCLEAVKKTIIAMNYTPMNFRLKILNELKNRK